MRSLKLALGLAVPLILWQSAFAMPQRMSYSETRKTIERIDDQSGKFEDNFDDDIGRTGLDSSARHEMKRRVGAFEDSAERLKKNYHKDNAALPAVNELLIQASAIDRFLVEHPVSPRVQDEWLLLRQDLDLLARSYDLTTNWPSALARTEYAPVVIVPGQLGSAQILSLVNDLQTKTDSFDTNVTSALATSDLMGTAVVNSIHQYIGEFKVSADRLRNSYEAGSLNVDSVSDVLRRAQPIDDFMRDHPLSVAAQESWIQVKNDLIRLAAGFNLAPAWLSGR